MPLLCVCVCLCVIVALLTQSAQEKAVLASATNLTLVQVNNWFSNRRVRSKKRARKAEEDRLRNLRRLKAEEMGGVGADSPVGEH